MRRFLFMILLSWAFVSSTSAQQIVRNYHDRSMSDVLIDLGKASERYKISFIYNELEDFTVTQNIRTDNVADVIRKVISYYPIKMTVGDSLITVECTRKSDHKLIGRLIDNQGLPVEFANVQLLSTQDSTFLCGGVSNANGDFVIPCEKRQAIMKVSFVGYKTICRLVDITRIGNVRMQADAYQLKKVVVKGSLRTEQGDHANYTFNEEQVKNARHSQDLLANLPGIYTDPMSGKTASMTGKSVKILINNVPMTSENDLKTIPSNKIKKVEYYDNPPARYRDAGIVMNIITKPLDTGYAVGFDVSSALTTGCSDDNVYFKYNKGNHQYSFDYTLNVRNYRNWIEDNQYAFTLDGETAIYDYHRRKQFGYTDNKFNLKYAYSKPEDITFLVTFSPVISHKFDRGDGEVKTQNNPEWQDGVEHSDMDVNYVKPALDLYLSKELPHKQTLDFDVLGNYFNTKQRMLTQQWTADKEKTLSDDDMQSKMNIYSLTGEANYTKEWEKGELTAGAYTWTKWSEYTLRNIMTSYDLSSYSSCININLVYAQYQNSIGNFTYRIGARDMWRMQRYEDLVYNSNYLVPLLYFSYKLKHGSLQLFTSSGINYPAISTLSENATVVIPGLLKQGNPNVKATMEIGPIFQYNYYNELLYIQMRAYGIYNDKVITPYYYWKTVNGERCIISTYENGSFYWRYGARYLFQLKPFKNEVLKLTVSGSFRRDVISNSSGRHCYWACPFDYSVSFRKGAWGASYQGNIPSKEYGFDNRVKGEIKSELSAFYQKGAWRFSLYGLWLFTPAKYESESYSNSVMNQKEQHVIEDNRRMVMVGVSYNFFSGKKNNVRKNINNYDSDSGAFK
jgi:hypothetical protein